MIRNNLRTAWRNCWKIRSVNGINIAGLTAGMTAAILIYIWVQNETSYDAFNPSAGRVYRVTANIASAKWKWPTTPLPLNDDIRAQLPQVEKVSVIQSAYNTWFHVGDEFIEEKSAARVGKDWFDIFHYDVIEGDIASFLAHPFSLVLTESKAKKYFGRRRPIGQMLRMDSIDYQVRAVIRDIPSNSSFQYDILIPQDAWLADPSTRKNEMTYNNYNYMTFLRLRKGTDPVQVAKKITTIVKSHEKESSNTMDLEPLLDMHFETGLTSAGTEVIDRKTVYIFSLLGISLLVIACINYVNLTTARACLRA